MTGESAHVWALVAGLALVSFATRAVFIVPGGRAVLPPAVERVLRFAPAAALMAIVTPDLVRVDGVVLLSIENSRLVAGMVAFGVAIWTRNVLATIVVGLAAFGLLRTLL